MQQIAILMAAGDLDDDLDVAGMAETGELVLRDIRGAAGVGAVVVVAAAGGSMAGAGRGGGADDG